MQAHRIMTKAEQPAPIIDWIPTRVRTRENIDHKATL